MVPSRRRSEEGLVDNIYLLIVLRSLQASRGAGFTPPATRIVVENYDRARDEAVGFFRSILTTGTLIRLIIGGIIVAYRSSRGVFLVNVPMGLTLIPLALRYVPADQRHAERAREPLDALGMVLLGCGLLGRMVGLTLLDATARGGLMRCVASLIVALIALAAFVWRDEHAATPLVPLMSIRGRRFGAVNVVNLIDSGAGMGLVR